MIGGQAAYGPQLPSQADLWQAQAAPWNEPRCSDADWERLILERHQTEAAYLARVDAGFAAEFEAANPEAGGSPSFDDDPAKWGLLPPEPMTEVEAQAAAEAGAWGPRGPSASYAEWLAEGEPEAEP